MEGEERPGPITVAERKHPQSLVALKRAALYARVSTQRQEQEETIENQLHEIKERIAKDGNVLLEECIYADDGWTGTILARPGLDRLREDARRGLFDTLYVYDRGRVARKFVYQEIVIEELVNQGIEFITLHDVKAETPEEQVLQAMQGVFHEYERIKILERLRGGRLRKVREGKLIGHIPPYGYVLKSGDERSHFEIERDQAEVVRMIYRWVAEGGTSIRQVIRRLHDLKVPPPKRRRDSWGKSSIARVLRCVSYTGTHYYNKTEAIPPRPTNGSAPQYRRVARTGRRLRSRSDWYPIQVPPIIDQDLFDKAQRQLALNVRLSRRNARHQYLLQGVIYCPCGSRRGGELGKGLFYYRCRNRERHFPLPPTCCRRAVNARIADAMVWNKLVELLSQPDLLQEQADRWLKGHRSQAETGSAALTRLKEEKQKLLIEEERYARAYGEGAMPLNVYRSQAERVRCRLTQIEEEIGKLAREKPREYHNFSASQLAQLAVKTISTLDFSDRQGIVRQLVEKVVADTDQLIVTGHIPLKAGPRVDLSPQSLAFWPTGDGQDLARPGLANDSPGPRQRRDA